MGVKDRGHQSYKVIAIMVVKIRYIASSSILARAFKRWVSKQKTRVMTVQSDERGHNDSEQEFPEGGREEGYPNMHKQGPTDTRSDD